MKEKRFAAGANRDTMNSIEEVGIEFAEFAELALEAMRGISDKLELRKTITLKIREGDLN